MQNQDLEYDLTSLCWICNNVYCSWLDKHIPVKRWKAKKYKYRLQNGNVVDTYEVFECPEFKRK